jgi:hypothetical protein
MTLKAHVRQGRLVIDEPVDLPEGTVMYLMPLDPGDELDEADRALLHDALRASADDAAAGRLVDAEDVMAELRVA